MRMNLVKENGLEREYYFGRKRNMVSYYKYKWCDEAKKYLNRAKKADSSNPVILEHLRVAELGEE